MKAEITVKDGILEIECSGVGKEVIEIMEIAGDPIVVLKTKFIIHDDQGTTRWNTFDDSFNRILLIIKFNRLKRCLSFTK